MTERPSRIVTSDALRDFIVQLLRAAGCLDEAAKTTADVLLEADLRGYGTHGLLRLPTMIRRIQRGMINPQAKPDVVKESEATALIDADRALGPVSVTSAARLAISKAKQAGSAQLV